MKKIFSFLKNEYFVATLALAVFLFLYFYLNFDLSGTEYIGIAGLLLSTITFIKTVKMEKRMHSKPLLTITAEHQAHDLTKDLNKRFTSPVNRINFRIVNTSLIPTTIKRGIPRFRDISSDPSAKVLGGEVFTSFIQNQLNNLEGQKLGQNEMYKFSIEDKKVLEYLEGFSIENTQGDVFSIPTNELKLALKERIDHMTP